VSLVAALLLAATTARVESVRLTTVESQLAVRVAVSGRPGAVTVRREPDATRVSIANAALGMHFAGGRRFAWTPLATDGTDVREGPAHLDRIEIVASGSEVSVRLRMPPDVTVDVRRDRRGFLLLLRPTRSGSTVPPPKEADSSAAAPSAETLELARGLFPGGSAPPPEPGSTTGASVEELYGRLFPEGAPRTTPETLTPSAEPVDEEAGAPLGPFHVRAGLDARYVDADTFVESPAAPVRDHYLEVAPLLQAEAPVSEGRVEVEYLPTFRALARYAEVNSSSHRLGGGIDLPVGPSVVLHAKDSLVSGVLDTREVDPGGEYFFGLGRFNRNALDGGVSIMAGPRLSLELAGTLSTVRFKDPSSFFDYDTRLLSAGLGWELTPNLKAVAAFVYDQVPRPPDRPEAEARAHSGQVTLSGTILPLLSGSVSFGFRDQASPNAGEGGTAYRGLVMSGSVSRQLGPDSTVTLFLNRSTLVSAFQDNGFYVTTGLQGAARLPLTAGLQVQAGLGYQWNAYRVVTEAIGAPRADHILALNVGLRRPIRRQLFVSASYRREERRSNVDGLDTNTDGFFVQAEWDILGKPPR
jgi:Putative beta-barrel porin 2